MITSQKIMCIFESWHSWQTVFVVLKACCLSREDDNDFRSEHMSRNGLTSSGLEHYCLKYLSGLKSF